jgi:hypothetical protein
MVGDPYTGLSRAVEVETFYELRVYTAMRQISDDKPTFRYKYR